VNDLICSEKRAVAVSCGTSEGAQFIKPLHDNHLLQNIILLLVFGHTIFDMLLSYVITSFC